MNKIDVAEAYLIKLGLELLTEKIQEEFKERQLLNQCTEEEKKVYRDTIRLVTIMKVRYNKISLTKMFRNRDGNLQMENEN